MKKLLKILLPIIVVGSTNLVACNNKKDSRVLLSFGDVHTEGYKEITTDKLNDCVINEESFILVINSTSCGCWDSFKPNLTNYVKENKLLCYQVTAGEFLKLDFNARYGLTSVSSSTTTFAVFEKGKLKASLNSNKNDNIMYDYAKFAKYMNETVILPKCFFICKEDALNIKASDKNAVIYFERSGCGDCNALNPTILYSYVKNHKNMNNIYVLDCQEYWRGAGAEDLQSYLDFKDEMGLSTKNNPTYGYGSGVFPFFSYIENGEYASGCVIYNDDYVTQNGKTTISDSYYTTQRSEVLDYTDVVAMGRVIPESELMTNANNRKVWTRDAQNKYYEGILNSFLDSKLPKVTFTF